MANIDSLQINISMANRGVIESIDKIVTSLDTLDRKLTVTSSAKEYTSNINALTDGFRKLGSAVSGIDSAQISSVQKSLNSLFNTMGKLSNNTFTNIGKKVALSDSVKAQIAEIKEGIKYYENTLKSFYSQLPKHIDLPKNWVSKLGEDDAKHKRGVLGIERTSVATGGMNNWAEVMEAAGHSGVLTWEEMAKVTGDEVDVLSVIIDKVDELNSKVSTAREEISRLERTASEISASPILDEDAIATPEMFEKTNAITTSVQSVSNMGDMAAENMRQIAEGLAEFQGITISPDQFAGLPKLASSAAQLSASNGESISSAIRGVGKGLAELSTVQLPNVDNLVTVVNAISKFGRGSIQNAGASVSSIASGLRELTPVAEGLGAIDTEKVVNLAMAMGKFGSAGAGRAATNLPQIAQGFVQLAQALSTAPEVSDKTLRLAEAMAQVSRRSLEAKTNTSGLASNFKLLGNHAHKAGLGFKSLAAKIGFLYANFFLLIRAARLAGKAIEYSSQMTEAMNVVDVAFGKMSDKMNDFMETSIKTFGLGRLAAAQYASRFQAMGKTLGITAEEVGKANDFIAKKTEGNVNAYKDLGDSVADMSINLTKLTADIASLYNQDYDSVAQDMQAVYTGMTRPLRKYGLDLTQATLKEWALANGLQADIDKMTQAEKTLLRYQYVMSNASIAMGDFQKTADTWANAMRTVKQLLQEFGRLLGEGFINAFKPALLAFRNFMYTMLDLTQKGLNAVGKLLGWEKIDFGGAALTEDMEDLADATDDATDAAKRLKGQLRGIDELNNLTTSDKGKGGGGVSSGIGYDGADLWEQIKETKEKYISDVKSWKDLGERISTAIYEGLVGINWRQKFKDSREFGSNLANFLNGLIKPETFHEVGSTIANFIMLGINFADAFATDFSWENLGVSIGESINGFFEDFDAEKTANAITKIAHGLETAFRAGLKKVDWLEVFKDLGTLIGKVTIDNLDLIVKGVVIYTVAKLAVSFGAGVLNEISRQIGSAIAKKIGVQLTGLGVTNIGSALGTSLIKKIFGGSVGAVAAKGGATAIGTNAGGSVLTGSSQFAAALGGGGGSTATGTVATAGTVSAGSAIASGILTAVGAYLLTNGFGEAMASISPNGKFLGLSDDEWAEANPLYKIFNKEKFENVFMDFFDAIHVDDAVKNFFEPISTWFYGENGFWANIASSAKKTGDSIYGENGFWAKIKSEGEKVGKSIYGSNGFWAQIYTKSIDIASKINGENGFWSKIKVGAEEVGKAIYGEGGFWTKFVDESQKAGQSIYGSNGFWVQLKNKATEIGNNIYGSNGFWAKFAQNAKSSFDTVKNNWDNLRKNIWNDPIKAQVLITQTIKTITTGAEAGVAAAEAIINGSVDTGAKTTTVPGTGSGKTRVKNPHYSNAQAQAAWEKAHPKSQYEWYAKGGFPEVASLFWAGENGVPELLGTVGGKTAVAGGSEITGIRDAIMQTASEEIGVLRQQNTLLQGILEKEFGISNDSLFRSVRNSANDFRMRTGRAAF